MTKPEWKDSYNNHTLDLLAVSCLVKWENTCYRASARGQTQTLKLKTEFRDLDEAKKSSLILAKKILQNSQALLELF